MGRRLSRAPLLEILLPDFLLMPTKPFISHEVTKMALNISGKCETPSRHRLATASHCIGHIRFQIVSTISRRRMSGASPKGSD